MTQYGIEEVPGDEHNPEILKYFSEFGFDSEKLGDETAWCSAVINWLCKKLSLNYTCRLDARSWLYIGKPVEDPQVGDLVVFWRGKDKDEVIPGTKLLKGHVGIFINRIGDTIYCLGGNQSNKFQISPYSSNKLLGYRRIE